MPVRQSGNFEFFIQWHLTEKCNLRCRHCYQGARPRRELNGREVKREIGRAARMFSCWEEEHGVRITPAIHFTGGEPLLFRALWDALAHSRQKGFKASILTNGTLIRKSDADKAAALGISDVQVSLEGPEAIHDSMRGKGSFRAALKGIRLLVDSGVEVGANVTLSKLNVEFIRPVLLLAKEAGCASIAFSRLVPCGSGSSLQEFSLSPAELRDAYGEIRKSRYGNFMALSGDPLFGLLSPVKKPNSGGLSLAGCSAGFSGVTIASDGSVMPCRRLGLVAGNILERPLREIWALSPLLWKFREKKNYHGKCGACEMWTSCRGCRAVAYAWSAAAGKPDPLAEDPQCWKRGQVFTFDISKVKT